MTVALAGLVAGFIHVFSGPDHLAGIAPLAVDGRMKAWRTGVRWGLGHTAGVLAIGALALVFRHALVIDNLWSWGERCVGFALVGIGIWGVRTALARQKHGDRHNDAQPHSHGFRAIKDALHRGCF